MAANNNIYQFKVSLRVIKPKIWRRIQVPGYCTFDDLHAVIQNSMGWGDGHLHQFTIKDPRTGRKETIGTPDDTFGFGPDIIPEENARIARYFVAEKNKARYLYDFGDGWDHEIVLEKILPPEEGIHYPRCVAGKRACPPEDCGGFGGYERLLEIIADPDDEEHKERMEWLEECGYENFDPEKFDLNSTRVGAYLF